MRDYRLSEIREICEAMHNEFAENACIYCENHGLGYFCATEIAGVPSEWDDIEPRDMIELPVMIRNTYGWVVVCRTDHGIIDIAFALKSQAEAFLAELKGGKE